MRTGCQCIDAAQSVAASVAQIELAVREVQPAVEQLGLLIDNMTAGLAELRGNQGDGTQSERLTELQRNVHGSITQLQFYDRLVQHLAHVQTFLSGVASHMSAGEDAEVDKLETLRSRFRVKLISEAQRELLDAVLPPPEGARHNSRQARDEHAAQGTVELF